MISLYLGRFRWIHLHLPNFHQRYWLLIDEKRQVFESLFITTEGFSPWWTIFVHLSVIVVAIAGFLLGYYW